MSWVKKAKDQGIQRQIDRKPENVARRLREEREARVADWKKAVEEKEKQFKQLSKKADKKIDALNADLADGGLYVEDMLTGYFADSSLTLAEPYVPSAEEMTDDFWYDQTWWRYRDEGVIVPQDIRVPAYKMTVQKMSVWSVFVKDMVETKMLFTFRLYLAAGRYRYNPMTLYLSVTFYNLGTPRTIRTRVTDAGFMSGIEDLKAIKEEIAIYLARYWENRKLAP